jgi:hypothetical protein
MSDLGTQLQELLRHDASGAPLVTTTPPSLAPRVRRRQLRTILTGGTIAVLIVLGSFAGIGAIRDRDDRLIVGPGSEPTRTATVAGVTISTPRSWHLIDRALGQRETDDGSATTIDVLEVANFDPGIDRSVCGSELPRTGAALWLGIAADPSTDGLQVWPVDLSTGSGAGCGPGLNARFVGTRDGIPFVAWVGFGAEVSASDRDAMLSVVASLRFSRDVDGTVFAEQPAYVIASGTDDDGPWLLETRPTDLNLELELARIGGRSGTGDFGTPEPPIEGWAFGAVTPDAIRLEFHPDMGGSSFDAMIVPAPPSFDVDFNLFYVERPSDMPRSGTWVATAADGTILGRHGSGGPAAAPPPEGSAPQVTEGPHDAGPTYAYRTTVETLPDAWRLSVLVAAAGERRSMADVVWSGTVPRSAIGHDGSSLNAVIVDVSDHSAGDEVIVLAFVPAGTAVVEVDMGNGGASIGPWGASSRNVVHLRGDAGPVELVAFATGIDPAPFGPIATVSALGADGRVLLQARIDWRLGD